MIALKKYITTFSQAMQSAMEYRADFLLSLLSGSFSVLIQFFLWNAIYQSNPSSELFGYQYNQMIVYIIMAGILSKVMQTGFEWEISSDIKNGGLSKYLVQPIHYMPYQIMSFLGKKLIQLFMVIIISILCMNLLGVTIGINFRFDQLGLLLLVILLALCMNFLIFYCISALAFWVTEIWAVFIGLGVVSNILSGGLFPLDVFGERLLAFFRLLPFQYVIYFPLNIISGKCTGEQILSGICIQLFWIVILAVISRILWHIGMKKYVAVGG